MEIDIINDVNRYDFDNLSKILLSHMVTMDGVTLHHGTTRTSFIDWFLSPESKIVYFSLNEQQSQLHNFDNYCKRDTSPNGYPIVYRMKSKRLRLLNLFITEEGHMMLGKRRKLPSTPFETNLLSFMFLMYNGSCTNTLDECNRSIILMISYMRKYFHLDIDGYVCRNDEDEVVLSIDDIDTLIDRSTIEFSVLDSRSTIIASGVEDVDDVDPIHLYSDICSYGCVSYDNFMMKNHCDFPIIYSRYWPLTMSVSDAISSL